RPAGARATVPRADESMAHGPAPAPTITWWALIPRPCGRSPRTGPRPAGRGRAPSLPGGPRPSAPQRLGVAAGGLVSLLPAEHPGQLVDQLGAVEADDRRRHRPGRQARVGRQLEHGPVGAARADVDGLEPNAEARVGHAEVGQLGLDRA